MEEIINLLKEMDVMGICFWVTASYGYYPNNKAEWNTYYLYFYFFYN